MEQKDLDNKVEKYRKRIKNGFYLKENIYDIISTRFLEEMVLEGQKA